MPERVSFFERNIFAALTASARLLVGVSVQRFPQVGGARYVALLAVYLLTAGFSLVFGWRQLTPIPAMGVSLSSLFIVALVGIALARPKLTWAYMLVSVPLDAVSMVLLGFPNIPVEVFWALEAWRFLAVAVFAWKQSPPPEPVVEVLAPEIEPGEPQPMITSKPTAYAWLTTLKSTEAPASTIKED